MVTTKTTKAAAAGQTLQQELSAKAAELKAYNVVITGLLKAVKELESTNPEGKPQVVGILSHNDRRNVNGTDMTVDLPPDGWIASNNGQPLADQLLTIARTTRWARVRLSGFWATQGESVLRGNYLKCDRKQLRVQAIEVLSSAPIEPQDEVTFETLAQEDEPIF